MSACDCPEYCPSCGVAVKPIETSPRPDTTIGKWTESSGKSHRVKSAMYVGTGTLAEFACGRQGYVLDSYLRATPHGKRVLDCQVCIRSVA